MLFFQIIKKFLKRKKINIAQLCSPTMCADYEKRAPYATLRLKASLTLEAAMVLPLFISAMVSLIFILQVMQLQLQMQKALFNNVSNACVYGHYTDELGISDSAESVVGIAAVRAGVINELGKKYIDNSYIVNGTKGLFVNVSSKNTEGILDVALQYQVKPPYDLFGLGKLNLVSRARARLWTGKSDSLDEKNKKSVYVTANASVYHTSLHCTYLTKKYESCDYLEIAFKRNKNGAKYQPCILCASGKTAYTTVYYTAYGERYHVNTYCSNMQCGIYRIPEDSAKEKYPLCSKCKKEASENSD